MAFLAELDAFALPRDENEYVGASSEDEAPDEKAAGDGDEDAMVTDAPAPAHLGRALGAPVGLGLFTKITMEAAAFPWNGGGSRAADAAAGMASFVSRGAAAELSVAARWHRALFRWEYDAAMLAASDKAGDGCWCMALVSAYEGWRARRASAVHCHLNALRVLWTYAADDGDMVALVSAPDARARTAVGEAVDLAGKRHGFVAAGSAEDRRLGAAVVVARGTTACRAVLNCVLNLKGAEPVVPKDEKNGPKAFYVLSDGAFDGGQLRALDVEFNRPVVRPGGVDTHRLVYTGWILPSALDDFRAAAAAANATAAYLEPHDQTAVFDARDVAAALAELADAPPAEVASDSEAPRPPDPSPAGSGPDGGPQRPRKMSE